MATKKYCISKQLLILQSDLYAKTIFYLFLFHNSNIGLDGTVLLDFHPQNRLRF